jgi:hypothetical protein
MGWGTKDSAKKTEIKEDFEIAVHDVTQGQWEAIMGSNPSQFSRNGNGRNDVLHISDEELKLFPVESVSWDDAQAFLTKLNEKERGRGYLYRLPTEAEWEYACRGGATSFKACSYHFYFDKPTNDLSSEQANFMGDAPAGKAPKGPWLRRTTRVGAYPSNKLGLCDMHGNVFQWCADPLQVGVSARVFRGGCWRAGGDICGAAVRHGNFPSKRDLDYGFRLARVRKSKEAEPFKGSCASRAEGMKVFYSSLIASSEDSGGPCPVAGVQRPAGGIELILPLSDESHPLVREGNLPMRRFHTPTVRRVGITQSLSRTKSSLSNAIGIGRLEPDSGAGIGRA